MSGLCPKLQGNCRELWSASKISNVYKVVSKISHLSTHRFCFSFIQICCKICLALDFITHELAFFLVSSQIIPCYCLSVIALQPLQMTLQVGLGNCNFSRCLPSVTIWRPSITPAVIVGGGGLMQPAVSAAVIEMLVDTTTHIEFHLDL